MDYFKEYHYTPKLTGIFLTSEGTTVEEKKEIADFFDCKVISFYGHSERAIIAVDIKANGIYKVYSSYGYPRIVDGELVVTSFVNRAMPLINYSMGDGAELIEDENSFYLKNITSRRGKDFIYLTKEIKFSITLLAMHTEVEQDLLYYQFHQKEFGKIEIRLLQKTGSLMPEKALSEKFADAIQKELKDFKIDVRIVSKEEIVKSHRGKMILLVQELTV
jgi:phenylacetate-CoA ligase